MEFVALASVGAAAADCGERSILAFERETWNLGKPVNAGAFVDVYAIKNTVAGLIGVAVTVAHEVLSWGVLSW